MAQKSLPSNQTSAMPDQNPINSAPVTPPSGFVPISAVSAFSQSTSRLSMDGRTYCDNITAVIGAAKVEVLSISTPKIEARVFVNPASGGGVALLFAETYTDMDNTPAAECAQLVVSAVTMQKRTNVRIIQCIVVTRDDYALAENAAAFIQNLFMSYCGGQAATLTFEQFRDHRVTISTNIEKVKNFVSKISMHAVPTRADIGFILSFSQPSTMRGPDGRQEVDQIGFLACTGYTRFIAPDAYMQTNKFLPVVIITDIVTNLPNPQLLALALPIAADYFITRRAWLVPYSTFAKGRPNLGALLEDATTKGPALISDVASLEQLVATLCSSPLLGIDVSEGRARPLYLDQLGAPDGTVPNMISAFYQNVVMDAKDLVHTGKTIHLWDAYNHTGTVVENGTTKDSRYVDFINVVQQLNDHKSAINLLRQSGYPNKQIEEIRKLFTDSTRSLYGTNTFAISADYVRELTTKLSRSQLALGYESQDTSMIPIQPMLVTGTGTNYNGISLPGQQGNYNSQWRNGSYYPGY